jgi:hypothetical protein
MAVTGTLPYDLNNLLGGAARVVVSDDATALPAIPATIESVIDPELDNEYVAKTGWKDAGATTEGTSYSRDLETDGYEIEQTQGFVFEEVTEVSRTLDVTFGEITPELVRIVENAGAAGTVAATLTQVAQKAIKFGSITTLDVRRVCFIAMRSPKSGLVIEPDGTERGRFVMLCLYSVTIAAESSEVEVAKGSLTGLPCTFTAFPEDGQPQGQEWGTWLFEDAGDLTP